jgi:hypothetical protein
VPMPFATLAVTAPSLGYCSMVRKPDAGGGVSAIVV